MCQGEIIILCFAEIYIKCCLYQALSNLSKSYIPKRNCKIFPLNEKMAKDFQLMRKQSVTKTCWDLSCIYLDRNEQWLKHYFFSKYETC